MKKILFILFLLYACNNDVNRPAAKNRIDNLQLARNVAWTVANLSFGTTGSIVSDQTLNNYIVYGLTGSVTLNGEVTHSYIPAADTTYHNINNVDMDFSGYRSSYDLTIAEGSLLVDSHSQVSIGVSVNHDIAGTIDVSGTISGEAFDDTIILDFEWNNGTFAGTLTNGEGIVFTL